MQKALTRIVLAILAIGTANATASPDAQRWQAMASTDLDAVRKLIVEAHPGAIDPDNPEFNVWVEQGYRQAQQHIPYVESYDTAVAVMRYYVAGFEDGHMVYSDNIRADFPILVTGWNIRWNDGQYLVANTLTDWSVPLPPAGAVWIGCDGLSAEEVLQTKVSPFTDRREGEAGRAHRVTALWLRRPVAVDLHECSFRTTDGELRFPVAYQPITNDEFFDAFPRNDSRHNATRPANAFETGNDVLWVRAGNFQLRENSADRQQLETMLAGLAKTPNVRAIVFDARGNRGGDSSIGDDIFAAATGGLVFDQTNIDSLPRYYAQWRVSDHLVRYLDATVEDKGALHGMGSPRAVEARAFRDRVAAAQAAGQPWVEQEAGRTITRADVVARHGRLRRTDAKIVLLTDGGCASACLDFADIVLQVPGAVHVGQTTGADSLYMVGSRSRMPSGNALVMPVKVWRNRSRGNNESLVPDVQIDLDRDEAAVRQDVLDAIGTD